MNTQAPAASARPDIISLDVLLNDVDEGRVQIPRFQRPYVWTPQMMRDLFESVLSGYPIGSLLFWTPRDLKIRTMDRIGPLPAPSARSAHPVSLVLDGHQRLATLYGVLRLPEDHPKDESASAEQLSWWLGYDLQAQEPRQMRRPEDFNSPIILPLRTVLRTADFVRFARSIDASSSLDGSTKSMYLDRADKIQRAIRDYRIALTTMRDGVVDDAVAIFSRINRSGRRMTTDQMAVALTYQDGFNLEEALDELLGKLEPFGFGDVSRTVVLQSLLHGAKRNFVKPNFDDLRKKDTQEALQAALAPVTTSLQSAAEFFNETIGFRTGRLLPYALQLLLLGVFFRKRNASYRNLDKATKTILSRWFWATSFEGWFASANSAEIERAVQTMEEFADSGGAKAARGHFEGFFIDRPLRPFPKTFDRRSARIRAMLLVQIARGKMLDPITGDEVDGSALMADPDRRDLPYVFPPAGTRIARSPANRILLARSHGSAVRSILAQHLDADEALQSHGIDASAAKAIAGRDLNEFVRAREARLQENEQEFLKKYHLHIGDDVVRSEEEIDIDE
jgi:hypothetical protein